jgi:type IV pilus assembly protein PilC
VVAHVPEEVTAGSQEEDRDAELQLEGPDPRRQDAGGGAGRREQGRGHRLPAQAADHRHCRHREGKEFALPKLGGGISRKEIAIFTRQFSVMIDAGLPLVQCLEILGRPAEQPHLPEDHFQVRQDVESGATLADALRKHPQAFDDLYSNMVAAGEAGGILDTILQRLSVYIEKIVKLRSAVRSALVYPVAVILIAVGVVWIILWKVIPTFATLFEGLGAQLPLPTRITIALSKFIGSWWWMIFIAIGLTCYLVNRYYKTPSGRYRIDKLLLKLPVLGTVLRKIAVARFCRTLGTLVSSGVPILEGLEITAKTAGTPWWPRPSWPPGPRWSRARPSASP